MNTRRNPVPVRRGRAREEEKKLGYFERKLISLTNFITYSQLAVQGKKLSYRIKFLIEIFHAL